MYHYTQPSPPDQVYWAERKRNLAELKARDRDLLENYGWLDEQRGLVRLPISRAMELTAREWQNPAVARSNLLFRVEKAAPPPAPAPATNAPATNAPTGAHSRVLGHPQWNVSLARSPGFSRPDVQVFWRRDLSRVWPAEAGTTNQGLANAPLRQVPT
ncbi:MAG: hypothetical protein NTW03_10360 [Verrucomicrobia bacterium]|nr:hypothetical protein [Verrucomicrobiota bacterium]